MMIPVDIRVGVYAGVVLGFSRRLLSKVLRPSRKAARGDPVKQYDVALCLEYRGKGLRCYVAGPWTVGSYDWVASMCGIATRWNARMPEGFWLSVPSGDMSDRMGLCEFFNRAGVGHVESLARSVAEGCRVDIERYLE